MPNCSQVAVTGQKMAKKSPKTAIFQNFAPKMTFGYNQINFTLASQNGHIELLQTSGVAFFPNSVVFKKKYFLTDFKVTQVKPRKQDLLNKTPVESAVTNFINISNPKMQHLLLIIDQNFDFR